MKNAFNIRLLLMVMMLLFSLGIQAATYTVWVGQQFYCDMTSAVVFSPAVNVKWTCSIPYYQTTGGTYNRGFTVTKYFAGTATIKCEWQEHFYNSVYRRSKTWTVSCHSNPVSVSPTELNLYVGETGNLYYSHAYTNQYASYANPFFSAASTDVVSVTENGTVKALKEGTAYVYCYSNISSSSASCKVIVTRKKPTGINIPKILGLTVGDSHTITPTFTPSDASSSLTWSSSNQSVATVSANGVIKALSSGASVIKVVTENNLSATCLLTVNNNPKQIKLSTLKEEIFSGDSVRVAVAPIPSHTISTYTWSSDNETVAKVVSFGEESKEAYIIGGQKGIAYITVKSANGLTASCEVMVKEYSTSVDVGRKIRKAKERITEDVTFIRGKHLK